jgi:polysaccharide chain length determinant protein (PEP-CTERM system associated)
MDSEQGIQLDDLKHILQRRGWLVLTLAAAAVLVAIFVAAVLPNRYESRATLLIEPQTISTKLVEPNLSETELNSRLHLISMQILSRGRLSKVIDEFDVYPDLEAELTREEIIERMRDDISVVPVLSDLESQVGVRSADTEINTFQLSYRHRNREIAAAVANRLANDFVEEHIKERAALSGDTSEFIDAELQRLSARIADLEQKISTVKSLNVGRLPEDMPANQTQQDRLGENIRETQRELAIAESDEAFFGQQVLGGGSESASPDSPERVREAVQKWIDEARARGLTDKHPDVIKLQQQMAQLDTTAEEDTDASLSFAQENARAQQNRAGLRARAARAELARLQGLQQEVEARLAETPKVAEQLAGYQREYQHLFESYQLFSMKRLEAGVASDMESRQKGEKFRVLEAAIPSVKPASPNRPVILVIGAVLGLLAGSGLALLAEITDLSFHDARSLQSRLGIPVLVAVPPVVLESDRLFARTRRVRQAIGAAAVVSVVLVASLAGNWIVNGPPGPIAGLLAGGGAPAAAAQAPAAGSVPTDETPPLAGGE